MGGEKQRQQWEKVNKIYSKENEWRSYWTLKYIHIYNQSASVFFSTQDVDGTLVYKEQQKDDIWNKP